MSTGRMYLESAKRNIWIFVAIFTFFMVGHQAWTPTASIYKHTYELSDPPGALTTDRGTFDFVASFTIAFMWLVPLTAALMVSYMGARWSEDLHVAITFVLWVWFIAIFVWQVSSLTTANPDPTDPADLGHRLNNPATDKRWCCVYGSQGIGTPCHLNTFNATCSPFVSKEMLGIDGTFLFGFILNLILIVLLTFDFFWVLFSYRPQVRRAIALLNKDEPSSFRGGGGVSARISKQPYQSIIPRTFGKK